MVLILFSALRHSRFSNPGSLVMNPGTAAHAVMQKSPGNTEIVATGIAVPAVKCFQQHAQRAEEKPGYPSNPIQGEGCTVEIAIIRSPQPDSAISSFSNIS